jgi:hypothetical protein
VKRTIAVAVATVGIGMALSHAVDPAHDVATPQARANETARQYTEARRRELEGYRLNAPAPADGAANAADASDAVARDAETALLRDLVP